MPSVKRSNNEVDNIGDQKPIKVSKLEATDEVKTVESVENPVNTPLYVVYKKEKNKFNPDNVVVGTPLKRNRGVRADVTYSFVLANGSTREVPLVFQTPVSFSRFGFSKYSHEGDESKVKCSVDMCFRDHESATLASFRALDAKLKLEISEHLDVFFPGKGLKKDFIEIIYNDLVKQTVKDGVSYDPYIRLKVQSFERDGAMVCNVTCFDADANKDNFKDHQLQITDFNAGCEFRGKVLFEGIYVAAGKCSPVVRVDRIQKISSGEDDSFGFVE